LRVPRIGYSGAIIPDRFGAVPDVAVAWLIDAPEVRACRRAASCGFSLVDANDQAPRASA